MLENLSELYRFKVNVPHKVKQYYGQGRLIYAQRYRECELNQGILINVLRNLILICRTLE